MKKIMLIFLVMTLIPVASFADQVQLVGVNYPGWVSATVDFSYTPVSPMSGQIDLFVTNDSLVWSTLTSLAWNVPANVFGVGNIGDLPVGWSAVLNPNGIGTPGQFGSFDAAELTGPNFSGGHPPAGIDTGESLAFHIALFGTGLNTLTAGDFLGLYSDLAGKKGEEQFMIARFQDIEIEGVGCDLSDVAIPVPLPPSIFLLGLGLISLAVRGRSLG